MTRYITKQRSALVTFLNRHPDELLSAKQIAEELADEKISVSAVYRNLADLEAEGKVRRSAQNGSREVYFQYIDSKSCKGHLHMHCVHCGKTFHLDDGIADTLRQALRQKEQFLLRIEDSVIAGVCHNCQTMYKEIDFE